MDPAKTSSTPSWPGIDHVQVAIPGTVRCHIDDPFGNRIELVDCPLDAPS